MDTNPTPQASTCPVCQHGQPDYRVIQLCQPKGFRTLFDGGRDFEGVFEWSPRATRPKTDAIWRSMLTTGNLDLWSGEGRVYIVNDNDGQLFRFRKLASGETWVTQEAVDQLNAQRIELGLPIVFVRFDQATQPEDRALGAVKQTDLLLLGLRSWPPGIDLSPLRVEGRAALYSFGFLLRRAAAVLLDIAETELRVGLRVVRDASGRIVGQIFLSDSLENGAGYCSKFAQPAQAERLLRFVTDQAGSFLATILDHFHASQCATSCPDCLRDYSNLAWHSILDWRLGLDVASLALDANSPVNLTTQHWRGLDSAVYSYFRALGWTISALAGLPAARCGSRGEVISHPLWSDQHPVLIQARTEAQASGISDLQRKTVFEISRRPF